MGCVEYLVRKQLAEVLSITTFAHLMLSDNYSRDFYPPDAMLARVLAMALCPCLSVCLSQVSVLSKGMKGLICFLACRLLSTSPTLPFKEIWISTKIRVLPS